MSNIIKFRTPTKLVLIETKNMKGLTSGRSPYFLGVLNSGKNMFKNLLTDKVYEVKDGQLFINRIKYGIVDYAYNVLYETHDLNNGGDQPEMVELEHSELKMPSSVMNTQKDKYFFVGFVGEEKNVLDKVLNENTEFDLKEIKEAVLIMNRIMKNAFKEKFHKSVPYTVPYSKAL